MKSTDNKVEVVFPESVNTYVRLQANNDFRIYENPPYVPVVQDFLQSLDPRYCLELGAGIGRMSVYFYKKLGWQDTFFYLQDGDSGTIQYGGVRQSNEGEYYNSFKVAHDFCHANELKKIKILNNVSNIDRKIDFCYSFAAIGFHWHINLYLDQLTPILADDAKLLFELRAPFSKEDSVDLAKRKEYQNFFDDQINYANNHSRYRVMDVVNLDNYQGYYYKDRTYFLILSKA
ncbi:MAG: hypothetical protein WBA13_18445 [Microcoleaceae cyanobacterium]